MATSPGNVASVEGAAFNSVRWSIELALYQVYLVPYLIVDCLT